MVQMAGHCDVSRRCSNRRVTRDNARHGIGLRRYQRPSRIDRARSSAMNKSATILLLPFPAGKDIPACGKDPARSKARGHWASAVGVLAMTPRSRLRQPHLANRRRRFTVGPDRESPESPRVASGFSPKCFVKHRPTRTARATLCVRGEHALTSNKSLMNLRS